jgi:hypothetical protein
MLTETLIQIFERDLGKLKEEISAYPDESKLWKVQQGISNSAGNLCLHLVGNLNHFIGATLGGTGYVRNRDSEFAVKDVPRNELLSEIDKTKEVVISTLKKLSDEELNKPFPFKVQDAVKTTGFFLTNLAAHLDYHLGQINYHRRLIGS